MCVHTNTLEAVWVPPIHFDLIIQHKHFVYADTELIKTRCDISLVLLLILNPCFGDTYILTPVRRWKRILQTWNRMCNGQRVMRNGFEMCYLAPCRRYYGYALKFRPRVILDLQRYTVAGARRVISNPYDVTP